MVIDRWFKEERNKLKHSYFFRKCGHELQMPPSYVDQAYLIETTQSVSPFRNFSINAFNCGRSSLVPLKFFFENFITTCCGQFLNLNIQALFSFRHEHN